MKSETLETKELNIYGAKRLEEINWTRYASRAIIIRDGQILLSYSAGEDEWMVPGGGREEGETAEVCCVREAEEETGFRVKAKEHFLRLNEYYEDCLYVTDYYICEILGEGPRHLTDEEVRIGLRPEWLPLEEALGIFSHHEDFAEINEMQRGLYQREYMALLEYQKLLKLVEITEDNWLEAASLSVREDQKAYLAPSTGIIARGYVYRNCNGHVFAFDHDGTLVGLALVREFTDEPLGYDLQQFMIDERYQGRGYGSRALGLILDALRKEAHYDHVEVCVKKADEAAIRLYEKHGFRDSGYIDPDAPDSLNMICDLF